MTHAQQTQTQTQTQTQQPIGAWVSFTWKEPDEIYNEDRRYFSFAVFNPETDEATADDIFFYAEGGEQELKDNKFADFIVNSYELVYSGE